MNDYPVPSRRTYFTCALQKGLRAGLAATALLLLNTCDTTFEVCTPTSARVGFFSRGDCVLTNSSFFQGHEWLTFFANADLPPEDQFPQSALNVIVEGNRRMDWPKELLVHLNNGLLSYVSKLTEYTDRPDVQKHHYLLTDTNTSEEASRDANELIRQLTKEAVRVWVENPTWAMTLVGKSNHILQDSFSHAHTVRDPNHPENPWCIRKVKAFITRAPGYATPDIEYHGGTQEDNIGHTTTEDSIYREGRDCHDPQDAQLAESCLSEEAQRGRLGTRDYLAAVRRILRAGETGAARDELVDREMDAYFAQHLSLCPW